jgi:plasmid stabilization system protein ParE
MSREVRISPAAQRDFARLVDFLAPKNPRAARRAAEAILAGLASLKTQSERGRPASGDHRELVVRFGRDGYVVQYRVDAEVVVIASIFHQRERRYPQP